MASADYSLVRFQNFDFRGGFIGMFVYVVLLFTSFRMSRSAPRCSHSNIVIMGADGRINGEKKRELSRGLMCNYRKTRMLIEKPNFSPAKFQQNPCFWPWNQISYSFSVKYSLNAIFSTAFDCSMTILLQLVDKK